MAACLINSILLLHICRALQENSLQQCRPLKYNFSHFEFSNLLHPCSMEKSLFLKKNHSDVLMVLERWQNICISDTMFEQFNHPTVQSLAFLNDDLLLIINGGLYRTHLPTSAQDSENRVYQLIRYSNIPTLGKEIESVFTTLCCRCENTRLQSHLFNEYILLTNKQGYVILFSFKSLSLVYDFGNLLQNHSVCAKHACRIVYLGLVYSPTKLMCVIQYQSDRVMIFHQPFFESSSTNSSIQYLTFTGEQFYVSPSMVPNAYFFWDRKHVYYTSNNGDIISKVDFNGCEIDNGNFCRNLTIQSLILSSEELFLETTENQWFYVKEFYFPSLVNLSSECLVHSHAYPQTNWGCLEGDNYLAIPCSSFLQTHCLILRFESLFDPEQIFSMEKFQEINLEFLLETYRVIPLLLTSRKSKLIKYHIDYEVKRFDQGIIRTLAKVNIRFTREARLLNETYTTETGLNSFRLGVIEYGYTCKHSPTITFQIETACSGLSSLKIERNQTLTYVNSNDDLNWLKQTFPSNFFRSTSPLHLKFKPTHPLYLNFHYCFNRTCQSRNHSNGDLFLLYAIARNQQHQNLARYLINRTDSCEPVSALIYSLWVNWTVNQTNRQDLVPNPFADRTFYQTLLDTLDIPSKSCFFFNPKNPILINQTFTQQTDDSIQFVLHFIAYRNAFSFCHLEALLLLQIDSETTARNTSRGWIFFLALLLLLFLLISLLHLYTYEQNQQRNRALQYHRLNQIDAGELHQWQDAAAYRRKVKTDNRSGYLMES